MCGQQYHDEGVGSLGRDYIYSYLCYHHLKFATDFRWVGIYLCDLRFPSPKQLPSHPYNQNIAENGSRLQEIYSNHYEITL